MRAVRLWLPALLVCGGLPWAATGAVAQPRWLDPNRDCRTVTTCQYSRGGIYRGCLSSYTCRVCRFVPARCSVGPGTGRVCYRMVCSWG